MARNVEVYSFFNGAGFLVDDENFIPNGIENDIDLTPFLPHENMHTRNSALSAAAIIERLKK